MSYIGNQPTTVASVPNTQEEALALFYYKDGVLFWKNNQGTYPTKDKPVGSKTKNGYMESKICGKGFKVHRMAFLLHHGWLPKMVDHIDGNRENNKIENLRAADAQSNKCNQKIYCSNTSGIKGVCWSKERCMWKAQINYNKKRKHLGYYENINEAAEFVELARQMTHQEFARTA